MGVGGSWVFRGVRLSRCGNGRSLGGTFPCGGAGGWFSLLGWGKVMWGSSIVMQNVPRFGARERFNYES